MSIAPKPHPFLEEFEASARALNLQPSTLGKLVNQGGNFANRLRAGNFRVWPETIEKVRAEIERLRAERMDVTAADGRS